MSHFRILGFGHAIVDLLAKASISTIHQHNIKHGGMTLIQPEQVTTLLDDLSVTVKAPGGSTANTIRYLANLGHNTGFIGGIGDDDNGLFFNESFLKLLQRPLTASSMVYFGLNPSNSLILSELI